MRESRKTKDDLRIERDILFDSLVDLQRELKTEKKKSLTTEKVKQKLFKLAKIKPDPPEWTRQRRQDAKDSVIPQVMLSDIHYGERVSKDQIFGINEYSVRIANERLQKFAKNTVSLLKDTISLHYPGLILNLNGDFLSGDIHEELSNTNELMIMPSFLNLYEQLIAMLEFFQREFGNLFVTGTAGGNHSRTTKKTPHKGKAYTNFDWLMYRMLERYFNKNDKIKFLISDGNDLEFQVYGHRYRQTHGDTFRGGTGFIGPFAPITRSETKKRTAAASYNRPYDTLIIGHFHQLMFMGSTIVNGSVVGYNEFALAINAPYEPPKQALWLNHNVYGITGQYPVFCEDKEYEETNKAISWPEFERE